MTNLPMLCLAALKGLVNMIYKFLIPFILALFLQLFICFKTEKVFLRMLPLLADMVAFIYAGARFWGLISFVNDSRGIYDGGLAAGIFVGVKALGGLIGIVTTWIIYYFVRLYKVHKIQTRSK